MISTTFAQVNRWACGHDSPTLQISPFGVSSLSAGHFPAQDHIVDEVEEVVSVAAVELAFGSAPVGEDAVFLQAGLPGDERVLFALEDAACCFELSSCKSELSGQRGPLNVGEFNGDRPDHPHCQPGWIVILLVMTGAAARLSWCTPGLAWD